MVLMSNLNLKKLVANDIINYAFEKMSDTNETNYTFLLDTYLEEYDEDTQKYINDNIDEIIQDIENNESVLDLVVNKENKTVELDIAFYWGKLLNQVEQIVFDNSRALKVELDYKDVVSIADDILDDDEFNDDLVNKIMSYQDKMEL